MVRRIDSIKRQLWEQRLQRFQSSGLTISRFCLREKVGVHPFHYWAKRLRAGNSTECRESQLPTENSRRAVAVGTANETNYTQQDAAMVQFQFERRATVSIPAHCLEAIRCLVQSVQESLPNQDACFQEVIVRGSLEGESLMLGLSPFAGSQVRIYLYAKDVDMRKSFDGLHAIIQTDFQKDVRLGDVFLFLNRRLDRLKLIGWDRDGLAIFYKRLEKGTFQRPLIKPNSTHVGSGCHRVDVVADGH